MILQTYMPGFEPAVETPVVVGKPAPAPPPAKKGAVPRREMTKDEQVVVQCLKGVTTPPACWDKRFIRDVGYGGLITEKEAAQAWRLFQKYRRRICGGRAQARKPMLLVLQPLEHEQRLRVHEADRGLLLLLVVEMLLEQKAFDLLPLKLGLRAGAGGFTGA